MICTQLEKLIYRYRPHVFAELLTVEDLQKLEACLPTESELKTVLAFEGPAEALGPAETFFRSLASVPRPGNKVSALLFWRQFSSVAETAELRLENLHKACEEATTSDRLTGLLEWVLKIGNLLNEGEWSGAEGAKKRAELQCWVISRAKIGLGLKLGLGLELGLELE